MKKCPYCSEEIQDEAKKCRFCGEWIKNIDRNISNQSISKESNHHKNQQIDNGVFLTALEIKEKKKDLSGYIFRRYLARLFDITIYILIVYVIVYIITDGKIILNDFSSEIRQTGNLSFGGKLNFLFYISIIFIEPIFLSFFGTTPGKRFFGIKIRTLENNKLSYLQGLSRTFFVYLKGLAFGIPFIGILTMIYQYNNVIGIKMNYSTSYDKDKFKVTYNQIGGFKWFISIIIFILYMGYTIYDNINYKTNQNNSSTSNTSTVSTNSYVSIEDQLKKESLELNQSLPYMINSNVRLNSTEVKNGNTLNYNYTLINNTNSDLDIRNYKEDSKKSILEALVTNKSLDGYFANGISIGYTYYDKNNTFLFDIIITPEEYYNSLPTQFSDL